MGAESSFDYDSSGAVVALPAVTVPLEPGEELLAEGHVWAGWGRRTPLAHLVVTDRRFLLLTRRLFGRGRMVEIMREAVASVSPPDEEGFLGVQYVAPGGSYAVVRVAPVRMSATEQLFRALADP